MHVAKYLVHDDPFRTLFGATADLMLAAAAVEPGETVLDIAAGTGLLTLELARAVGATGRGNYDGAVCRFAIMYFGDPMLALTAIRTALRPGGRFVALVWTDPSHALFANSFGPLGRIVARPAPVPGAPSPFRYATPGSATAHLEAAGFVDVVETTHVVQGTWPGTVADIWDFFTGAAPA